MSNGSTSNTKSREFVGFHLSTEDARDLYKCASDLGIPVARLIRFLVVEKTDRFQNVDYVPPQSPEPVSEKPIRSSKRRFS